MRTWPKIAARAKIRENKLVVTQGAMADLEANQGRRVSGRGPATTNQEPMAGALGRGVSADESPGQGSWTGSSPESELVRRALDRRPSAIQKLFSKLWPTLERWARGRLPRWARARLDTRDLVQEAFLGLLPRLHQVEPKQREALRNYLRESIRNKIRDEVRRAGKVEVAVAEVPAVPDTATSPLEASIRGEDEARYRAGLSRLTSADRELIVGRIELGYSYEQLALAAGKSSAGAARVAVRRALLRLAEVVDESQA